MKTPKHKLILMGNFREYKYSVYCPEYEYIGSKEQLYGKRDYVLYLAGQYWNNSIYKNPEFLDFCKAAGVTLYNE